MRQRRGKSRITQALTQEDFRRYHASVNSPLFAPGLLSGGIGAALLLASRGAAATATAEADAPTGRATPLTELFSPVTERPCACYRERMTPEVERPLSERSRPLYPDCLFDRVRGVFLVETASGRVLVWPGLNSVAFADGWTQRSRSGENVLEEQVLAAGAQVVVRVAPGRYEEMMTAMASVAADQPLETLKALQTRADLRGLPCYWPGASELLIQEVSGDPADEPAGPGTFIVAGAAFIGLAALLLGGAAAGIF